MNEKTLVLGAALALFCALALALLLIGAETLRELAFILVAALALAAILAAASLPIRAYRKRDMTGEHHYHHDGTRTVVRERVIDGRTIEAPKLYQLPAQQSGAFYPELLRSAWQAGLLANPRAAAPEARNLEELDLTGGDPDAAGWAGDISG